MQSVEVPIHGANPLARVYWRLRSLSYRIVIRWRGNELILIDLSGKRERD